MVTDAKTEKGNLPKPHSDNKVNEEFPRLAQALELIGSALDDLTTALGQKPDAGHGHAIDDIEGLAGQLQSLIDGLDDHTHAFSDLVDVNTQGANEGQILQYQAGTIQAVAALAEFFAHKPIPGLTSNNVQTALAQLASQLEQLRGGNAPELLDTIQELANALGDDPNFATTVMEHQAERAVKTRIAPEGGKPQYFDPTRGDGGAWVDIGSGDGVPVGGILGDASGQGLGPGWLKLGNGATFDVTIYKKLALKYPDGVLPDPDDRVLRGAGALAGVAGTVLEDALQDHNHEDAYASNVSDGTARTSGRTFGSGRTVAETGESQELSQGNAAEGNETHPLTGPASAVPGVRTASETRVKSLTVDWYIKAADTVDAPEIVQALSYVASLNAVVSKADALETKVNKLELAAPSVLTKLRNAANLGIDLAPYTDADGFAAIELDVLWLRPGNNAYFAARASVDGGATLISSNSYVRAGYYNGSSSSGVPGWNAGGNSEMGLTGTLGKAEIESGTMTVNIVRSPNSIRVDSSVEYINNGTLQRVVMRSFSSANLTGVDFVSIYPNTGQIAEMDYKIRDLRA
ncbi:hypothetical protein TRICHSKD4_2770 [Roseibium sp. TrichSKD4]|uniref:hypothetical protein n=1 Tax=Roseibium sp. TrichSKD4 TaxID=744980 RepID=UPI0001E56779|nr:hypothetical protein [Roseibium sp. TrichSKD4]EFO31683.1 hypothetical protein TRICHSKD4_2770 [Roseibium sp. TrichSKD4]